MQVKTTDIYFSAYLLAKGITLDAMNVQNGGRRQKILFIFSGKKDLDTLNHAFQTGKALVNPIDLKKSILHLKDMMYDKIRVQGSGCRVQERQKTTSKKMRREEIQLCTSAKHR